MTSALELATAVRSDAGRFVVDVPDGWQQGRGAFGGIVVGALARAMLAAETDGARTLRTITADLCAPVQPGEHELVVEILRHGKRQTNADVQMIRDGEVVARAGGTLSAARPVELPTYQPEPPEPPDWRGLPRGSPPPNEPVFTRHFAFRPTGYPPFAGGEEARCEGWIAPVEAPSRWDAPMLLAMLDVWWPSAFSIVTRPITVATTMFAAQILCDPAEVPADEPLCYRAETLALREGFSVELRELWSHGRLVAANQQTMVLRG